jgi:uncharacterized RDD family membrane protein YckC
MSIITINTPFNIDLEFRVAAFHKRLLAWCLDFLVICAYNYIVVKFIVIPLEFEENTQFVFFLLLAAIPSFLYHLLMEQFLNGQSIGKKVMGIKVISQDGDEPTIGQYLLRWILGLGNFVLFMMPYVLLYSPYYLIFMLIFYLPDVLCIAITGKSQRLADLAARTVLIDNRHSTHIEDTIYLEIEETEYTPVFPEVMRLTDRDINGIRNLLDIKKRSKDNDIYMVQIAYRIKEVLKIESNLVPEDFLQQLLKDYNYLTRK